jgi:hypothetical protein
MPKARWLMEPTMPLKKEFSDLRLSFDPLTWLPASRLLLPRSGLERSDFVQWHL